MTDVPFAAVSATPALDLSLPLGSAEKMGEVSRNKVHAIREAMEQARVASSAGNYKACEQALACVQRLLHP